MIYLFRILKKNMQEIQQLLAITKRLRDNSNELNDLLLVMITKVDN